MSNGLARSSIARARSCAEPPEQICLTQSQQSAGTTPFRRTGATPNPRSRGNWIAAGEKHEQTLLTLLTLCEALVLLTLPRHRSVGIGKKGRMGLRVRFRGGSMHGAA